MKRRELMMVVGGMAVVWPLMGLAQQSKLKRIAFVNAATKVSDVTANGRPYFRAFFGELNRLGLFEGQNLQVDRYSGEGKTDHYTDMVRDAVNTRPDLIFAPGGRLALEFKRATTTIPIVTAVIDPVALGLASSIARPGGNITGVTIAGGLEIIGKRMGLLVEALPNLSAVGYLTSRTYWEDSRGAAAREAAKKNGLALSPMMLAAFTETEYQRVFSSTDMGRPFMVSEEPEHITYGATIVELAARGHMPSIYPFRDYVDAGGLMAYSVDLTNVYTRLAGLIDEILRGANPADIPFYQPVKFELIINLKTAKALGLEMSAMLIGRADEVIE